MTYSKEIASFKPESRSGFVRNSDYRTDLVCSDIYKKAKRKLPIVSIQVRIYFFICAFLTLDLQAVHSQPGAIYQPSGVSITPIADTLTRTQTAKRVTIQEALVQARAFHPQIRAAEWDRQSADAMRKSASDIGKTDMTGAYGQISSILKDNYFTITQSFPWPGNFGARARLYDTRVQSIAALGQVTRAELDREVRYTYIQLQAAMEQKRLTLRQDSLSRRLVEAAAQREKTGKPNPLEGIVARSKQLEIRNRLEQVNLDIQSLEMRLGLFIGAGGPVGISDSYFVHPQLFAGLDTSGIQKSPTLEQLRADHQQALAATRLEKAQAGPNFLLGYFNQSLSGPMVTPSGPEIFGPWDRFHTVLVGISIPIWIKPQLARIKAAGLAEKAAEARVAAEHLRLITAAVQLENERRKLAQRLEFYRLTLLPHTAMMENTAQQAYESGMVDFDEWVVAIFQSQSIRQDYLDALLRYNEVYVEIQYLIGE